MKAVFKSRKTKWATIGMVLAGAVQTLAALGAIPQAAVIPVVLAVSGLCGVNIAGIAAEDMGVKMSGRSEGADASSLAWATERMATRLVLAEMDLMRCYADQMDGNRARGQAMDLLAARMDITLAEAETYIRAAYETVREERKSNGGAQTPRT